MYSYIVEPLRSIKYAKSPLKSSFLYKYFQQISASQAAASQPNELNYFPTSSSQKQSRSHGPFADKIRRWEKAFTISVSAKVICCFRAKYSASSRLAVSMRFIVFPWTARSMLFAMPSPAYPKTPRAPATQ